MEEASSLRLEFWGCILLADSEHFIITHRQSSRKSFFQDHVHTHWANTKVVKTKLPNLTVELLFFGSRIHF